MNLLKTTAVAAMVYTLYQYGAVNAGNTEVHGYFQTQIMYESLKNEIPIFSPSGMKRNESKSDRIAADVTETDLILKNQISPKISAYADLQFLMNYSSDKMWGDFNLDEIWAKFDISNKFIIKTGYLVPVFNNMNDIKTRFPLLPYIIRPSLWESALRNNVRPEYFLPLHAALQVNGAIPVAAGKFDYAVFFGNSEFLVPKAAATRNVPAGSDSANYKLIGGRLGVRFSNVKLGVSGTYDYSRNDEINEVITKLNSSGSKFSSLGASPRERIGVDLSFSYYGFSFESEAIGVYVQPKDKDAAIIESVVAKTKNTSNMITRNLSKQYVYAALTYSFLEKFDATVMSSFLRNQTKGYISHGRYDWSVMGGYHINDYVTLKLQFKEIKTLNSNLQHYDYKETAAGVSVYF